MEDGPHDLRVVNSPKMVANVQTEDDLVQLGLLNPDSLVAKRRGQLSQEVRQSDGPHVELTHWIVLGPSVLEGLDVLLLESQDVILVLCSLVVIETFTNDGNEHVHENEESNQLEEKPVDNGNGALVLQASVHDSVPRLTRGGSC